MSALKINSRTRIVVGKQGENNAKTIDIDISRFTAESPNANVSLMIQRYKENRIYPARTAREGNVLKWTITAAETSSKFGGSMQIVACDDHGDIIAKSEPGEWRVWRSLEGTEGEAPEPEQAWVMQVLGAGSAASDAADRAEAALQETRRAIAAGELNGEDGLTPHIGENGNWFLGDMDTGQPSRGESTYDDLRLGNGLKLDGDGMMCVDTADAVQQDNTKPVTSAAVYVELGNVEALLSII